MVCVYLSRPGSVRAVTAAHWDLWAYYKRRLCGKWQQDDANGWPPTWRKRQGNDILELSTNILGKDCTKLFNVYKFLVYLPLHHRTLLCLPPIGRVYSISPPPSAQVLICLDPKIQQWGRGCWMLGKSGRCFEAWASVLLEGLLYDPSGKTTCEKDLLRMRETQLLTLSQLSPPPANWSTICIPWEKQGLTTRKTTGQPTEFLG